MSPLKAWFLIGLSILFAFFLLLMPLPGSFNWYRPSWLVLTIAFWILLFPGTFGVWLSWWIGLLLDVIYGSLLGEHALALAFVAFLLHHFQRRINNFHFWQQGLCITGFVIAYQSIIFIVQGLTGTLINNPLYWMSAVSSLIVWPWLYYGLHRLQRKYRLYSAFN